jgi:hypothetical protein
MSTKNKIQFVAAWTASTGSISVLVQDVTPNVLAITTSKPSVKASCVHTFDKESFEKFIPLSQEQRDAVYKADAKNSVKFDAPVDAQEALGMELRIQTIEAIGQEKAIELGIFRRDKKTGVVSPKALDYALKRSGDTKQPVYAQGRPVFRTTRLVNNSPEFQDIKVEVSEVEEAKPTVTVPGTAEVDENLFT